MRNLAFFSWSESYWLFLLIPSQDRDIKETLLEVTTRCFILGILNVFEVTIKTDSSASHILKDFTLKDPELRNFQSGLECGVNLKFLH